MIKSITSDKYLLLISWLKDKRLENNLSMRELAVLIDEPHQFIGKIETAERRLDIYEYVQYCQALKIDPAIGLKLMR
jgi:transcriptional regulator with XRE-family HTH domain